jgi:hypothetical protein
LLVLLLVNDIARPKIGESGKTEESSSGRDLAPADKTSTAHCPRLGHRSSTASHD